MRISDIVYPLRLVWALLFFSVLAGPAAAAEIKYVVRKNDTLSEIAQRHGITTSTLIKHNLGVSRTKNIYPGQILKIPVARPAAKKSVLDPAVLKSLGGVKVEPRKWKNIVIHHSATGVGSAQSMDRYHREKRNMQNGLAYHFVIGNGQGMPDGQIAIGRRWTGQIAGGHLASEALNQRSIGICLVGNFDQNKPTAKQMVMLHGLIDYLMDRCNLSLEAVKTHQQINPVHTKCPGSKFPMTDFVKELKLARR